MTHWIMIFSAALLVTSSSTAPVGHLIEDKNLNVERGRELFLAGILNAFPETVADMRIFISIGFRCTDLLCLSLPPTFPWLGSLGR